MTAVENGENGERLRHDCAGNRRALYRPLAGSVGWTTSACYLAKARSEECACRACRCIFRLHTLRSFFSFPINVSEKNLSRKILRYRRMPLSVLAVRRLCVVCLGVIYLLRFHNRAIVRAKLLPKRILLQARLSRVTRKRHPFDVVAKHCQLSTSCKTCWSPYWKTR